MKTEVGKAVQKKSSILTPVCLQIKNMFQAPTHDSGMWFIHMITRSSELHMIGLQGSAYAVANTEP